MRRSKLHFTSNDLIKAGDIVKTTRQTVRKTWIPCTGLTRKRYGKS